MIPICVSVNFRFVNIKNNGTINWLISSKYPKPINAETIAAVFLNWNFVVPYPNINPKITIKKVETQV